MPKYRFAVRSPEGKLRTGSVTELSLEAAKERLKSAGFVIVSLQEEAELVILEAKSPGGAAGTKTSRAAIIEFETTLGERVGNFFGRYILRKEFAVVLFALGAGWAGYQHLHAPKPPAVVEAKYLPLAVEVEVDSGAMAGKGTTYHVGLPDIPLRFSRPVSEGSLLKYEFESIKQPGRVQVTLVDSADVILAEGEGLLTIRKEGLLVGAVPMLAVKKTP